MAMRIVEVVVVYDVDCPSCSAVARELPELMRVPVTVRSCRDPYLPPDVPAVVRACAKPALGVVRPDGTTRWQRSPGGLVTALEPFVAGQGGAWVGWSGSAGDAPEPFESGGMSLIPLKERAVDRKYDPLVWLGNKLFKR